MVCFCSCSISVPSYVAFDPTVLFIVHGFPATSTPRFISHHWPMSYSVASPIIPLPAAATTIRFQAIFRDLLRRRLRAPPPFLPTLPSTPPAATGRSHGADHRDVDDLSEGKLLTVVPSVLVEPLSEDLNRRLRAVLLPGTRVGFGEKAMVTERQTSPRGSRRR